MQIGSIGSYNYNFKHPNFTGCSSVNTVKKNGGQNRKAKQRNENRDLKNTEPYPFSIKNNYFAYRITPKVLKDHEFLKISDECREAALLSIEMAKLLKKNLDKSEGAHNYTIVSIGTSPAGVMKSLELMGEDVRYIPVSGFRKLAGVSGEDIIQIMYEDCDIRAYKDFLASIGLSVEDINESKKKVIFYDYTSTGTTLDVIQYLSEHEGIKSENVEFRSLNDDLMEFSEHSEEKSIMAEKFVENYLRPSKIGKYSGVPHLNYIQSYMIDEVKKNPLRKEASDFEFTLMYYMDKFNMLNKRKGTIS